VLIFLALLVSCTTEARPGSQLARDFQSPPDSAKPWVYWWWLDSAASREGITADFVAMKQQGISGVLLFDAGEGGTNSPKGPVFMSAAWRELFTHTLREADRLGLEVGVNLCSGWNAGGTWVTPELAAKKLVWSDVTLTGPGEQTVTLPPPNASPQFYRDIAVVALRWRGATTNQIREIELKAGRKYAAAASCSELADRLAADELPGEAVQEGCPLSDVQVLTDRLMPDGRLTWRVPDGQWLVLRFGYTLLGSRTKCPSPGSQGYEIDFLNPEAFDQHFAHTGQPLLEAARGLRAKSLKYFHVDSYESGNPSWSAHFAEEFRARRGYDLLKWMPVLAGWVVENREASHRFLWDIRRTLGDLYAANYYGRLAELSHRAGIRIHPESSGPFWHHIDALQCAGGNDVPMSEFWKRKTEDREWVWWLTGQAGFCDLVKQVAAAAHTYGRPICQAEAFTTMGPNWEEDPFSMKDIGDRAFCAGLTRNVLCFYVHQPEVKAFPGYQWEAAGTHFDSHITWWPMSHAWFTYLARCQQTLRQGHFVADFGYFYGEDVPNFVPARSHMQPALPAGYDCDCLNAEVLLQRLSVRHGRLTLPDGMSYRYLVLPQRRQLAISTPVLRKIQELVRQGATVLGPPPQRAPGLTQWPQCDETVRRLAAELWGENLPARGQRTFGQGRVIWGYPPAEVLAMDQLPPDVEFRELQPESIPPRFDDVTTPLDWIHRRMENLDLYFIANVGNRLASARIGFRTTKSSPEIWDPVTGQIRPLPEFAVESGRTWIPIPFQPKQSFFVVFRGHNIPRSGANFPMRRAQLELTGPWSVAFDPAWGGPAQVTFAELDDWSQRPESGIRFYSGQATYRKSFTWSNGSENPHRQRVFLDLGRVANLARVKLNGQDLGVVWTAPWQVEATPAIRDGANELTVEIVNLWPNRLVGDAALPLDQRRTTTNVRKFEKPGARLVESGLRGPVRLLVGSE